MLVSIVICTYNRVDDLDRLLQSTKILTYPSLEIIVVDNNSSDDTAEIAAKYNVKYVFEPRQGLSYARNRGIEESSGEYIAMVDDDVIVTNQQWVEEMLRGFSLSPNIGVVGGKIVPKCAQENYLTNMFLSQHGQDWGNTERILSNEGLMGANMMYSYKAIHGLKFNTELGRIGEIPLEGEESQLHSSLKEKGFFMAYIPTASVDHMIRPERFTYNRLTQWRYYKGVSNYLVCHNSLFSTLPRPILDVIKLIFYFVTFNKKRLIRRYFLLTEHVGICCGPFYY